MFCARFCGIAAIAAVPDARVETPVRAEHEIAAVVVSVRVLLAEQRTCGSPAPLSFRRSETLNGVVTDLRRVRDVEAAIARVLRVEGKPSSPCSPRYWTRPRMSRNTVRRPFSTRITRPGSLDNVHRLAARPARDVSSTGWSNPRANTTFRNALSAPAAEPETVARSKIESSETAASPKRIRTNGRRRSRCRRADLPRWASTSGRGRNRRTRVARRAQR